MLQKVQSKYCYTYSTKLLNTLLPRVSALPLLLRWSCAFFEARMAPYGVGVPRVPQGPPRPSAWAGN